MAQVWDHSRAEGLTRLVLLALADHADHDGYAWPAVSRVAQKCRVSRATVQRAYRDCEAAGELERVRPGGTGAGDTALYRVMPALVENPANGGDKGLTVRPLRASSRTIRASGLQNKGLTVRPEPSINHQEPRNAGAEQIPLLVENPPPMPDPDELAAHVAEARRGLRRPGPAS
jgi:DNA-binding transcriptional MocR family regulator